MVHPAGCLQKQTRQPNSAGHKNFRHATVGFIIHPALCLNGSTCMAAWMIESCSESVWTSRHERHYQCSSCRSWHSRGVQSVEEPGTSGSTESLIFLNKSWKNRCSLLADRREVKGVNLLFQGNTPSLISQTRPTRLQKCYETELLKGLRGSCWGFLLANRSNLGS